jgi:hypothetical protein
LTARAIDVLPDLTVDGHPRVYALGDLANIAYRAELRQRLAVVANDLDERRAGEDVGFRPAGAIEHSGRRGRVLRVR